ncbi:MAG: hypothetical protein HFH14_01630 [Lachnospiraceae bacterium]|nr:hypothetical protein [Lachnospiraceae bacterium]
MEQINDQNLYVNCYAYNEALTAYEVNESAKALYNESSENDIRNALIHSADNIKTESDNRLNVLNREESDIDSDIKTKEASGVGMSRNDYKAKIALTRQRDKEFKNEYEQLIRIRDERPIQKNPFPSRRTQTRCPRRAYSKRNRNQHCKDQNV